MKLRELREDYDEEDVQKDAREKFLKKLSTELQKVLANPNITQVTTPAATTAATTQAAPTQQTTQNTVAAQQTAQTRQQRQATAATAAQSQMAQNATPAPNVAQQAGQIRQQKQAGAAQAAQSQMVPVSPKPKVWRSGRNPNGPAFARENIQFARLNALFESIINVDEATPAPAQVTAPMSMSDVVTTNFVKLMNAPNIFGPNNPDTLPTIQKFAKEIADTYQVDGGKKAIYELGNWAWDTMKEIKRKQQAARWGIRPSASTTPAATNVAPQQAATLPQTPSQPAATTAPAAPAEVQQSKVGVRQINKLIPTLRKRDLISVKKNVDNTLAGKSSIEPSEPTNTGANAFGQMAGQLSGSNKTKSSTGGTTTKTTTGLVHSAKPKAEPQIAAAPKDNTIKMPKGKVRASREGGVTPEEQAKFDEKVRQAMANQKE